MLQHFNNLDRTYEQGLSNYPFTHESTRDIKIGTMPQGSFLAISVNVDENTVLPCRLKGMSPEGKLVICDSTGAEVCHGQLYKVTDAAPSGYVSFFLYNANEVLSGFIFCKVEAVGQLMALTTWYPDTFTYFNSDAFVLLPECHVQTLRGAVRSFKVGSTYITADLCIRFSNPTENSWRTGYNVVPSTFGDAICINVYNVQEPEINGLCQICVNGTNYWIGGKNIVLKASMTSNLRVVYTNSAIVLKGVGDV